MSKRDIKFPRYESPISIIKKEKPHQEIFINEEFNPTEEISIKKSKHASKKRIAKKVIIKRAYNAKINASDQSSTLLENYGNKID